MGSFDALSGKAGCPSASVSETTLSDKPVSTCSGKASIVRRETLKATNVFNGTIGSFILSVYKADGSPVEDWVGRPMERDVPLDISNLTLAITGEDPKFSLAYVNVTGSPTVTLQLTYVGPGPELCFDAVTSSPAASPTVPFTISGGRNTTTPGLSDMDTRVEMCIPPNVTGEIWIDANTNTIRDAGELPLKKKPVRILLFNKTWLDGTMDDNGLFIFDMPYLFANETFEVYDTATGAPLATFTTDANGTAFVPIPIPVPPKTFGKDVLFGGNSSSSVCALRPYDVEVKALLETGNWTRTIQVDFAAGNNYSSGSIQPSEGWLVEFSTDGGLSWNATEPVPSSQVSSIRATSSKPIAASEWQNGTDGAVQMFTTTSSLAMNAGQLSSATSEFSSDAAVWFHLTFVCCYFRWRRRLGSHHRSRGRQDLFDPPSPDLHRAGMPDPIHGQALSRLRPNATRNQHRCRRSVAIPELHRQPAFIRLVQPPRGLSLRPVVDRAISMQTVFQRKAKSSLRTARSAFSASMWASRRLISALDRRLSPRSATTRLFR